MSKLSKSLRSILTFSLHCSLQILNMALWAILIVVFGIVRILSPNKYAKDQLLNVMHKCYFTFGIISVRMIKWFNSLSIDIDVSSALSKEKWYLIIPNHLSYLDIILLIEFCAHRTSPPKFFLKKELTWMPFVGQAAWAMDMPFMKRYSKQYIEKYPHLKGKDIETTRRSCEKFVDKPTSVINFVEGTRFTRQKAQSRNSDFEYLMRPKAGGIAFTLAAMGEQFSSILDVTLCYQDSDHPMMDMLCGNLKQIKFRVNVLPLDDKVIGDYFNDESFRQTFQEWLNTLWSKKDQQLKAWLHRSLKIT